MLLINFHLEITVIFGMCELRHYIVMPRVYMYRVRLATSDETCEGTSRKCSIGWYTHSLDTCAPVTQILLPWWCEGVVTQRAPVPPLTFFPSSFMSTFNIFSLILVAFSFPSQFCWLFVTLILFQFPICDPFLSFIFLVMPIFFFCYLSVSHFLYNVMYCIEKSVSKFNVTC